MKRQWMEMEKEKVSLILLFLEMNRWLKEWIQGMNLGLLLMAMECCSLLSEAKCLDRVFLMEWESVVLFLILLMMPLKEVKEKGMSNSEPLEFVMQSM